MLEQVPFTRLKYHADYCALTKRMGFPVRHYAMYSNNPTNKPKRHASQGATYFPKYSRYIYKNSNLSPYQNAEYIKTYNKSIYMFAIQDSFSRFIVHACLREQPDSNFRYIHSWFNVEDCFKEAFDKYGKPFEFAYFAKVLPDFLRFLVQWIFNKIALMLLIILSIIHLILAVYSLIIRLFVRKARAQR
ncbi:hypothetical protein [[Eubacterium] cellulosolvens]